jgi:hypothetical protein
MNVEPATFAIQVTSTTASSKVLASLLENYSKNLSIILKRKGEVSGISGGGLTYLLLRLYDSIRSQPQENSIQSHIPSL